MREKLNVRPQSVSCWRITPASAGKTYLFLFLLTPKQDHPRECGKNEEIMVKEEYRSGSPPRVREKRPVTSMVTFLSGITPASAGKTTRFTWDICFSQDHPRECGKNSVLLPEKTGFAGSPPRVREKPTDILLRLDDLRITPASAGKTTPKTDSVPIT